MTLVSMIGMWISAFFFSFFWEWIMYDGYVNKWGFFPLAMNNMKFIEKKKNYRKIIVQLQNNWVKMIIG